MVAIPTSKVQNYVLEITIPTQRKKMLVVIKQVLLSLILLTSATLSIANIGDFDEAWKRREEEALQTAHDAYDPKPYAVNDHINMKVHLATQGNSTRRSLRRYRGPCRATNPIDRCWRCDPNWAKNRKKLAKCVLGFGRRTIGGKNGKIYVVTNPTDYDLINPKPGTLRYGVTRKEPLWIIFARDMIITLKEELLVASYKTIDARGANVHVAFGAQITVQYSKHVIIHGLHVHHTRPGGGGIIRDCEEHVGLRTYSDGDGITVFASSFVWIDHVSMYNCADGLIDVIQGSTAVTISNNHFTRHDHVMLFGASDFYGPDSKMQITVAFNHFGKGLIQRMPRCRLGFFHVVNNDYTHWQMYAIGGSKNSTIISQGNRYIAPNDYTHKEVTHRVNPYDPWHSWKWRSENDLMMNGAFFVQSGTPSRRRFDKKDMITAKSGSWVTRLSRFSGALTCKINVPC